MSAGGSSQPTNDLLTNNVNGTREPNFKEQFMVISTGYYEFIQAENDEETEKVLQFLDNISILKDITDLTYRSTNMKKNHHPGHLQNHGRGGNNRENYRRAQCGDLDRDTS